MSFITKRERVFNEYDLYDLPPRNEGKLKAYASCTDARAWSHFCSDKTEHLVEIIKRNNETCRTKYVPTNVIVETLMVTKNAEIARLKRKIEEFEQMLAIYDQLDLTCEQKCEIASAHAAIKAANKELDELCLDLDLSGFTEGMDSDAFQTGKSRGDESAKSRGDVWNSEKETPKTENKSNQTGLSCPCDASTSAHDPRIQEMQEVIISKDAKLSAMQNTKAVMENDLCEPYCIYAHIYTALEKIFGVLCQNDKYKLYLSLMTAGKDIRCIDIKGKILFKLKVLEKFSLALIAPCSQYDSSNSAQDCACLRAEVIARLDSLPPITADTKMPSIDNKRAQLVADIMDSDEMKEILSKESTSDKNDDDLADDLTENYSIDAENLKRLKNLQENYDDLMSCYEKLKHEKGCLLMRCNKYEELEKELETLRFQLREYNSLWNEKEHYRKRSKDIDSLREQYVILADESSSLETQLKAETEINYLKSSSIEKLRSENIALEKKLNETMISFEKEKNALQCKLKETDCTVICQEQQIRSLSVQVDRLLEQGQDKVQRQEDSPGSLALIDQIESLKEQIKNLKDALYCSEEEKQQLQEEFQDKLKLINDLRMEIEDWKSTYEKTAQRNDYLEKYTDTFQEEVNKLIDENRLLSQDVEEKTKALENLRNVVCNKSQEVNNLSEEIVLKEKEKINLFKQVKELRENYDHDLSSVEDEKIKALEALQLARQESQELLDKVKDYNNMILKSDDITKSLESKVKDYNELKDMLENTMEHNTSLQMDLMNRESNHSMLLEEIQRLRDVNTMAINSVSNLQEEKKEYKTSLELTKKESKIMENKLAQFKSLSDQMDLLKLDHDNLMKAKGKLENELKMKKNELEKAVRSIQLSKKESEGLINKLEHLKSVEGELLNLNDAYNKLISEKSTLQNELIQKRKELDNLYESLNDKSLSLLKTSQKVFTLETELTDLKKAYIDLHKEKQMLQDDFNNKTEEIKHLHDHLELKIDENQTLLHKLKSAESDQEIVKNDILKLQNRNLITQSTLKDAKRESAVLIDKLKQFESLENEYDELKHKNESLQEEFTRQQSIFKRLERENHELENENKNLLAINEDLEKSLINTRKQLIEKPGGHKITYDDIFKELEDLRKEKLQSHNKVKNLLDRLDESENIISNLSEDILAGNDKISILENHINELEDEIRRLHDSLSKMITVGEEIKDNSFEKYDSSIKAMEAHHSKAAHNIRMELAKLHGENAKLEQQLSATKIKSEESGKDNSNYLAQIKQLNNERKIIITDIKQLELKSVGDSALSPEHCTVEDIITSLNRIGDTLDLRSSRSNCLEQTILKVQTSSQLLLSKANEAKILVEKEKQKIVSEKEEAIRDRLNMEKKLEELKKKLENQIAHDNEIIKDLEANILNQKLINKSTQNHISKLKDELQGLQSLHQNSVLKIADLQEKIRILTEENKRFSERTETLDASLKDKTKDLSLLQNEINKLKNKSTKHTGVQVNFPINSRNVSSQTSQMSSHTAQQIELDANSIIDDTPHKNNIQPIKPAETKPHYNLLPNQNPHSINEVQILTANIDPTFDFVKSSYMNYKLQRLSPGRLEQYSISNEEYGQNSKSCEPDLENKSSPQLFDNCNRSINSISSETFDNKTVNLTILKQESHSPIASKTYFPVYSTIQSNFNETNKISMVDYKSQKNKPDKDLLVIYKESDANHKNKIHKEKIPIITTHKRIDLKVAPKQSGENENPKNNLNRSDDNFDLHTNKNDVKEEEYDEDDIVKPKLKINLPRVDIHQSHSAVTTSEGDKKSSAYTLGIYVTSKQNSLTDLNKLDLKNTNLKQEIPSMPTTSNDDNSYIESYNTMEIISDQDNIIYEYKSPEYTEKRIKHLRNQVVELTGQDNIASGQNDNDSSHHRLSRVEADVYLIKSKSDETDCLSRLTKTKKPTNFALDYILDSVQREVGSENGNMYNLSADPRKNKSEDRLVISNIHETNNYRKCSPLCVAFSEFKNVSSPSYSSIIKNSRSPKKSLVERGIMVNGKNIDDLKDYETKIQRLARNLEVTEKDYKQKLEAIKSQYDSNIKNIINEHNQGVKNIQGLHEETLQDILKIHENEVENLRTMSIEANRKVEKLEKENRNLKIKIQDCCCDDLYEEPIKISSESVKGHRRSCFDTKMLTKTKVEAYNVKPKIRSQGPCTCSLDVNISDTIKNIFEQVDVEQRKMAECTYIKYIANKILNGNVEALDSQELSFLHLKVCRTWKVKLSKEEALQKRIDNLESELLHRQRHAQQHIADLDRQVEEEKRRLQEVREAVCRTVPTASSQRTSGGQEFEPHHAPRCSTTAPEKDLVCGCKTVACSIELAERRSAGDLAKVVAPTGLRPKRTRNESNRAVLVKIDTEEKRERRLYNDEPPTRLRRTHERQNPRVHKK